MHKQKSPVCDYCFEKFFEIIRLGKNISIFKQNTMKYVIPSGEIYEQITNSPLRKGSISFLDRFLLISLMYYYCVW